MLKKIKRFIWIARAATFAFGYLPNWQFTECWAVAVACYEAVDDDDDREDPKTAILEELSCWDADE